MPIVFTTRYCQYCKRQTQYERQGANHILHLILTVLTGGLWLLGWIAIAILSRFRPRYCCNCRNQD